MKICYHDTPSANNNIKAHVRIVIFKTSLCCNWNSQKKVLWHENIYWRFNLTNFSNEMASFDLPQVWFLRTRELFWWAVSMSGAFQQSSELCVITLLRKKTSSLIKASCGMFLRSSKQQVKKLRFVFPKCQIYEHLTWCFTLLLAVHTGGEGVAEGDGGEEHFDANDEVLPTSCHRTSPHFMTIDDQSFWDHTTSLQNGQ